MRESPQVLEPLAGHAEILISNVDKKTNASERPVRLCNYMDAYTTPYLDGTHTYMTATASPREIHRFGLRKGDVVITKDSETPDDIGIAAVIDDAEGSLALVCGYHLAILRTSTVDPVFLAKQLVHDRIKAYFGARATGSTRYGLSTGVLDAVPLFVPPRLEQVRIGQILRTIDHAIRLCEAVIAKLDNVKRGLLNDLLTCGIDDNGEIRDPEGHPKQFKNSRLGRIPRGWNVAGLESFSTPKRPFIKTGPFGSTLKGHDWVGRGVPVITIGALGEGDFVRSELLYISDRKAATLRAYAVKPGDVVFSRVADVGRSAVVRTPQAGWILSSNLMWISLDTARVHPDYLWLNLAWNAGVRRQVRCSVNAGGREVANGAILRELLLPWPNLQEQTAIVASYTELAARMRNEEQELAKLRLLKRGVADDLLTGRVRVGQCPESKMIAPLATLSATADESLSS